MCNDLQFKDILPAQNDVPMCFGCGQENPLGIKLRFFKESDIKVSTKIVIPTYWSGWGSVMHGGFHGLLLDEITAWVPFGLLKERSFVTRELNVKYHRPAYIGSELYVTGELVKDNGKTIKLHGEILDTKGNLLSEADSIIVRVDKERMKNIMSE